MAVITAQSAREMDLQPDDHVCAIVKTTAVHVAARPEGRK
jgi:molybdopterin-binding protein